MEGRFVLVPGTSLPWKGNSIRHGRGNHHVGEPKMAWQRKQIVMEGNPTRPRGNDTNDSEQLLSTVYICAYVLPTDNINGFFLNLKYL